MRVIFDWRKDNESAFGCDGKLERLSCPLCSTEFFLPGLIFICCNIDDGFDSCSAVLTCAVTFVVGMDLLLLEIGCLTHPNALNPGEG